jgi:hypothetical protein
VKIHSLLHSWILPPEICKRVGQIYFDNAGVHGSERETLIKNMQFRGKYDGQRCFVIGNGPSLNQIDLSRIMKDVAIAMNRFDRHPMVGTWQPNFLCMLDPASSFVKPEILNEMKSAFMGVLPRDGFFFHISNKQNIESFGVRDHRAFYVKTNLDIKSLINIERDWELTEPVPGGWSTSVLAIMLAMYIGCKEIYLVGMDHNWLADKTYCTHFYQYQEEEHQSYREMMEYALKVFKGYEVIKRYADSRGVHIWNATPGSYLDVFPRIEYEKIFEEKT